MNGTILLSIIHFEDQDLLFEIIKILRIASSKNKARALSFYIVVSVMILSQRQAYDNTKSRSVTSLVVSAK